MTTIESLIGWVPICRLDDHVTLGMLDGRMAIDGGQGRRLIGSDGMVSLLPLLEQPFSEFLALLDGQDTEMKLEPGSLRRWVPWPAVVRLASLSPSAYWAELALRWIEGMPFEDRDEVALLNLATNRHSPQAPRHRALRVLRSGGKSRR